MSYHNQFFVIWAQRAKITNNLAKLMLASLFSKTLSVRLYALGYVIEPFVVLLANMCPKIYLSS